MTPLEKWRMWEEEKGQRSTYEKTSNESTPTHMQIHNLALSLLVLWSVAVALEWPWQ